MKPPAALLIYFNLKNSERQTAIKLPNPKDKQEVIYNRHNCFKSYRKSAYTHTSKPPPSSFKSHQHWHLIACHKVKVYDTSETLWVCCDVYWIRH